MFKTLVLAALAVLLVACGGSGEAKQAADQRAAPAAAAPAAPAETPSPVATVTAPPTPTATATATPTPPPAPAATPTPTPIPPTPTPNPTPTPAPVTQPPAAATPAPVQNIQVRAGDYYFEPKEITVRLGQVSFIIANDGPERPHTFAIRNRSGSGDLVRSSRLEVGQSGTVQAEFREAGTYEFYCTLPGHADRGQRGTLTVRP